MGDEGGASQNRQSGKNEQEREEVSGVKGQGCSKPHSSIHNEAISWPSGLLKNPCCFLKNLNVNWFFHGLSIAISVCSV